MLEIEYTPKEAKKFALRDPKTGNAYPDEKLFTITELLHHAQLQIVTIRDAEQNIQSPDRTNPKSYRALVPLLATTFIIGSIFGACLYSLVLKNCTPHMMR